MLAWSSASWACGPRAELRYAEAWPDVFEIRNLSPREWQIALVRIDLDGSAGTLFLDPGAADPGPALTAPPWSGSGPGSGPARLVGVSPVRHGDTSVTLMFVGFAAGTGFVFSIDVDGRDGDLVLPVVPPGAMAGAIVQVRFVTRTGEDVENVDVQGRFDGSDTALTTDGSACG